MFNILFTLEIHLLLDFHFHPESLAVEAILIAQIVPFHGMVSLEDVFVSAPPSMVNTHRIIGCNRTINEGPFLLAVIRRYQFLEDIIFFPVIEHFMLKSYKIDFWINFFQHRSYFA